MPCWFRNFGLLLSIGGFASHALAAEPVARASDTARKPHVVWISGSASHGYGEHEFNAGGALLTAALGHPTSPVTVTLHRDGWPENPAALDDADAVVLYMDGGKDHPALDHLEALEKLLRRGAGLVAMHYALEVPKGAPAETLLRGIGGFYESGFSTNPVWTAQVTPDAGHPIARGVRPFVAPDEWYFNIHFAPETTGLRPIASAVPDDEARENPSWPPFAADHITAASGRRETLIWALERPDGGRGVGFTGGHFHWNWGNDDLRRLLLNAVVWAAGAPVPANGMSSPTPNLEELEENQDERPPWFFFDRAKTAERFDLRPNPDPADPGD